MTTSFDPPLGRGMGAHEQFYNATTMIGFPGALPRFFSSGFFVGNVTTTTPFVTDDTAVMFLVTARHVIADAIFEERELCIQTPRFGAPSTTLFLPADVWLFAADNSGLATIALPSLKSENIVGGYNLPVITPEQFYVEDWRASGHDYRMGDAVRALGLWYGANAHPQLIVRSGTIATATLGPVQFETGAIQAYLMDVTVTRAMSGVPVYATRGRGWAESALLGVTYGYWPVDTELLEPLSEPNEAAEDRFRRAMLQEVERLNSRLTIVTPVHHLAELLIRHALWNAPTIN